MKKLYFCEYLLGRSPAFRHVLARNPLHAVDLLFAHHSIVDPHLDVTNVSVCCLRSLVSPESVKLLNKEFYGKSK